MHRVTPSRSRSEPDTVLYARGECRTLLRRDEAARCDRRQNDDIGSGRSSSHDRAGFGRRGPGRLRGRQVLGAISGAADPADPAVPGRRRGRSRRPAGDRTDGGGSRAPVRDREQGRRRRRDRGRRHRQGGARRLHAPAHHAQPHHQRRAQSQALLRHREGPAAGLDRGRGAGVAGEPSGGAVRDICRLRRLRQKEPRQAQLFLGRQRHLAAPASRSRIFPIAARRRR